MNTRLVDSGQLSRCFRNKFFPNLSQKEEGLAGGTQQALVNQLEMVAGNKFELTTFWILDGSWTPTLPVYSQAPIEQLGRDLAPSRTRIRTASVRAGGGRNRPGIRKNDG